MKELNLAKMHKVFEVKKELLYGLLISFVVIFLFWLYTSVKHADKTPVIYSKFNLNEILLNKSEEIQEKVYQSCFQGYVNENDTDYMKYKLKDLVDLEETVLNKSNGKNIFFYTTECSDDRVVKLNMR